MHEPRIKQVTKAALDELRSQARGRKREDQREAREREFAHEVGQAWVRDEGTVRMRSGVERRRPGAAEARERRVLDGMEAPDAAFEGSAGEGWGRRRVETLSRLRGGLVAWDFDAMAQKWRPAGMDASMARKLRLELSDAHGGKSPEEVCAQIEREDARASEW